MATREWITAPRRRGRCYVAIILTILVVCTSTSADDGRHRRRPTTRNICQRDPPDIRVDSMPGDHGFRIQILGHAVRYTPGQVYTVSVGGSYTDQRLEGFMLVAVPLNAQDETTAMGTFQHIDAAETQFVSECPHVVTEVSRRPRSNVELIWTAPASRAGCIEFRAAVIERGNMWFRDDGALTRVFCEDTRTTEGRRPPELVPDCCACGTAKYEMTFEGRWSEATHPKDYPTQRRLLHWSNIVGASHSRNYMIWQYGDYASRGVREVCELGYPRSVQDEIDQHIREVRSIMKTTGIWWSNPEGLIQNRTVRFSTDRRRHLMSLITMLGPSPDWCVGVSALDMCLGNCTWSGDRSIELYPWDAGTDDGITYMSPNARTDPQQKIRRITDTWPSDASSPFYGIRPQQPLATLHIRRLSAQVALPPASGSSSTPFQCPDSADEDLTEPLDDQFAGLTDMEKQKLMMMQQQDGGKCALSEWGDWSACSVTCGVGQRVRKRRYHNPMVDENMCGLPVMETENCIGLENVCETVDEDCAVTQWSTWSPCSVTCGEGTSRRLRYYLNKDDMVRCQRQTDETQTCRADVLNCDDARRAAQQTGACSQPMSVGPCRGSFVRWYYDTDSRRCRMFTYGGCRGNGNRFDSAEQCRRTCEQPDVDAGVSLTTSTLSTRGSSGGRCALPAEVGPCRGSIRSWYHDTAMRKCLPFTYGGCRGNANRFATEYQCTSACVIGDDREPTAARDLATSTTATWYQPTAPTSRRHHSADTTTSTARRGRGHRRHRRVNCAMSPWSSWSSCPTSCDADVTWSTRERHVVRQPQHGGRECPTRLRRRRRCRPPPHCAADEANEENAAATRENEACQYSEWSDWSPCSKTCGSGGVQERQRRLLTVDERLRATCGATLRLRRRMCSNLPPCNAAGSHHTQSRQRRRNADVSRRRGH